MLSLNSTPAVSIAERVRALREALGLSQDRAAERAGGGWTRVYISKIERGVNQLTTSEARARLAAGLGISEQELVDYLAEKIDLNSAVSIALARAKAGDPNDAEIAALRQHVVAMINQFGGMRDARLVADIAELANSYNIAKIGTDEQRRFLVEIMRLIFADRRAARTVYDSRYPNLDRAVEAIREELHPETLNRLPIANHGNDDQPVSEWIAEIKQRDKDVKRELQNRPAADIKRAADTARAAEIAKDEERGLSESWDGKPKTEPPEPEKPGRQRKKK